MKEKNENKPAQKISKVNLVTAIIMFGLTPFGYLYLIYQSFLESDYNIIASLFLIALAIASWWLLYAIINRYKNPLTKKQLEKIKKQNEKEWGVKEWIGWSGFMLIMCFIIAALQNSQTGSINIENIINDSARLFGLILIPFIVILAMGFFLILILKLLSKKWTWICIGLLFLYWVISQIPYTWILIIILFFSLAQQEDRINKLEEKQSEIE